MPFYTPLRYPGGKGKLSSFVQKIFLHNNLLGGTYIEPYSGGAGVALSLLLEGYASKIIINDIDYAIYAFWHTILNDTEWFCSRIEDIVVDMENWYVQREINNNPHKYSISEVGFSTFFMNRTNRSGIIKGGVIGGKNQNGPYKIDARYNKSNLISRIQKISKRKNDIEVHNEDAIDLCKKLLLQLHSKTFFYFDPPYFIKGGSLYRNSYSYKDHAKAAHFIKQLNFPWIITYDDVQEIRELYEGCMSCDFSMSYSAYRNAIKGREILFYSNLLLPE